MLANDEGALKGDILELPAGTDATGSPYRSANYDLAKNYTLYLGLVLAVGEVSSERADAAWVQAFLARHGGELLGPRGGARGGSDRVLGLLLRERPAVRADGAGLLDTERLGAVVLRLREQVARRWIEVMRAAEAEQLEMERRVLEDGF